MSGITRISHVVRIATRITIAGIAATGCLPLRRAAGAGVAQHQTISTINGYLQAAITPSARTRTRAMLAQARPAVSPRRVSRAHVMWVQTVVSAPKWGHVIGVQGFFITKIELVTRSAVAAAMPRFFS